MIGKSIRNVKTLGIEELERKKVAMESLIEQSFNDLRQISDSDDSKAFIDMCESTSMI